MRARATVATLLLLLAIPSAAGAATISTSATQVLYSGGPTDLISMSIYATWDPELNATAAFFLPTDTAIVDPTTTDPDCTSRPTGASSCKLPASGEIKVTTQGQSDFLSVGTAGNLVIFEAGGGDDRVFVTSGTRLEAYGQGGNDWLQGGGSLDILDGGPGDDLLDPSGPGDRVFGGAGLDTARMAAGGVAVTLDDAANDGKPGENQNIHADVEKVLGGSGADSLDGNAGANELDGGDGNDAINGLGGPDKLLGGNGDDVIVATDRTADEVKCGPGNDRVQADPADAVAGDCEAVVVVLPDDDHDGYTAPTDCDDTRPEIHPGAGDVPGNGVDEDCSGADAALVPLDADHDGSIPPLDCDDTNAAIHPGAVDVPGDGIDQDCAGGDAPFPRIDAKVVHRWTLAAAWSRVEQLSISRAPAGANVTLRCKGRGCAFTRVSVKVKRGRASVARFFKHRKLRRGTVVEVAITARGYVGKVVRLTVRGKRKLPTMKLLCLPPGARSPRTCGR